MKESSTVKDKSANGIVLSDLRKDYGTGSLAVDGVDIDIAPGEFMTFLGPSGSGKTTTLNMIAGFEEVTSGSVVIADSDVSTQPAHKRDLGMVFQSYALFPHLTVEQNIAFPLKERKVAKDEIARRVAEALELVHLGDYGKRYPRELSGGQQQRVALARAVVFRPRALLLDEPLGALDRKLRASLQLEIRRMHRELGLTCVFVTHDQEEALFLSDRIAVFNKGKIEQLGTPSDLYNSPKTLFVAQFLGDSNVFPGVRSGATFQSGGQIWALASAEGPSEGHLIVRPEHVEVHPADALPSAGHNATTATVESSVFLGTYHRLELRFPDGTAGLAMAPARARDSAPAEGTEVVVSWSIADQCLVP
ncbi:ABC transporter ATP-binding protein [Herbiconiux sp. KACC 21604]|uniref:ABC transporter ATP-binding protein n=1 Tax=unclassified Herbiconiux TaxID=2618217 RepID=UPI001C123D7C|nr:ABC transporter ATP-binding protein [Herbiconiux sp. SALV-R1]WPO86107.1 ABC transporter ATP-binding protein [Herbiconiux sp. KACC 21604]